MKTQGTALCLAAGIALLAGCASGPRGTARDGAPSAPPSGLERSADAEPRIEPIRASGGTSKPYTVLGRAYSPITDDRPFRETGLASWYGTGFHAKSTASGEPYDMYAMTAAHKTLPLPSYVRVRNPANGREAIVRVNDRGPFHDGRIIDLSYAAAARLDLLRGVAPVEIERITNEDIRTGAWRRDGGTQLAMAAPERPDAARAGTVREGGARDGAVAVPVAWAAPVAARSGEFMSAAAPSATGTQVAQADVPPTDGSAPVLSDTAPPPRFRGMEVSDLPALTPAPAQVPAPSASPAASSTSGATPAKTTPSAVGASSAAAAPAASSSGAPAPGFWIQLGAFRDLEGADGLRAQAAQAQPALASRLRVFSEGGTHRLQAGPYATREAATSAAAPLRDGLRLAPIVVERR